MVGTIDFQLDGKTIEQHPLVVMQEVKEGNFFSRIWDMVMMKLSQWFGDLWLNILFSLIYDKGAIRRPWFISCRPRP